MNARHDPELDDVLQDEEMRRIGELLSSTRRSAPPLDDAFRSGLRRQLMQQAWQMGEGRPSLWRRVFAPPGLAWVGATAGLVLIAGLVVFYTTQQPGGFNQIFVQSPIDGSRAVALQQPILVNFNQPMDHPSTEAAVQIMPATNVTFSWSSNTLAVQPASGILAPNTQYQVTIGSTAKTASGQSLTTAQTITFVTQPPATPTPSPSPTPRAPASPSSLLTGEHQLAPLGGPAASTVQWSADSSTVYFVNSKGALEAVPAKGGDVSVVVGDGVSSPAIAPAGDQLAYIRGGKIEVLTLATGTTTELAVSPAPTLVGWATDKVEWAAADGIYTQGGGGSTQLAALPRGTGVVSVLSLAPDGGHAAYRQDQNLFLMDLTSGKSLQLGQASAVFYGWSPGGTQVMYSSASGNIAISDVHGNNVGTLPGGDAGWSSQEAILLGSDTDLYQVRPDGSAFTKLSNGTYRQPAWAPNGAAFTFFRGGALWSASAPALPPQPTVLDLSTAVVNSFMQARQKGQSDQASALLDSNGKQAYASGGLNLIINGDPSFSRFYILTQDVTGTQPDTATFVVRLVLTHGKLDVSDYEETLTVVRDATRQFLIDQATAGAHRDLGKGAEVVGVVVAVDGIQVTFDSDLNPGTVAAAVHLLDSKGRQVDATVTYSNRTVTISGLDLKPGAQYELVVLTTLRDFLGHNIAAEYDLQLVGPVAKTRPDHKSGGVTASPAPLPSPSPSPTPS
ncbi:MAG TPA: Ig-like domain-containing protein [Candidatus Dormibacteraeota bacterium]|nr:Ig-like domain-containing protein [Candidatus Dormibacteraeota bacterium]